MMQVRRLIAADRRPTCQWLWHSQRRLRHCLWGNLSKAIRADEFEEYEVAIMAAYTAPAATVEEFKAHISTGRPLPGRSGLLFKGQRDAPQGKSAYDFKGTKEKKPCPGWQADKRPISDETGIRNKVLPYNCKGCDKYAHHFATANFKDFTVATKCDQGDCRHPLHDGTVMGDGVSTNLEPKC